MKIDFLLIAKKEYAQAVAFYDSQLYGLGQTFVNEVDLALDILKTFPSSGRLITKKSRRYPLQRFPYLIFYYINNETITVSAIMHQYQHPEIYISRL